MLKKVIILILFYSTTCYAEKCDFKFEIKNLDNRASIMLSEDGYSKSGGDSREKEISIKVEKDMFDKTPLSIEEKITALESKISYYNFFLKYNINLNDTPDLIYKETPLKDALNELLPGVPISFKDVDEDVKIKKLMSSEAPLESILKYLDDAAGVYFEFTRDQLIVKNTP